MKNELGKVLAKWRIDQGMSRKEMANDIGISESYLSLIENDIRNVTIKIVIDLSIYTGIDLQKFVNKINVDLSDIEPGIRMKIVNLVFENAFRNKNEC
jgi:transcriptional regulator with XRE-family HTH domain